MRKQLRLALKEHGVKEVETMKDEELVIHVEKLMDISNLCKLNQLYVKAESSNNKMGASRHGSDKLELREAKQSGKSASSIVCCLAGRSLRSICVCSTDTG